MSRNNTRATLEAVGRHYSDTSQRARFGLTVQTGETSKSFNIAVLGVVREKRQLIVTAPMTPDKALITVIRGHALICRWLNATTAFRFRATILKIAFEPIPVLYLELPLAIERKIVRKVPRALINLNAIIRAPDAIESLVVDLSVSGARLAMSVDEKIETGVEFELTIRPYLLERSFLLSLKCVVTNLLGAMEAAHPGVQFVGVEFRDVPESDLILLHACVQERLAQDADWLTHMLTVGPTTELMTA